MAVSRKICVMILVLGMALFSRAQNSGSGAETPATVNAQPQTLQRAWVTSVETLWPRDHREQSFNNIRLYLLNVAYAWHWESGWELQMIGTLMDAKGKTEAVYFYSPSRQSKAIGFGFGPSVRWTPFSVWRIGALIDLTPNILATYPDFPAGGTRFNVFGRVGLGLSCALNKQYTVELAQRWSHISNGDHYIYRNPAWDGTGVYIAVRRNI